MVVPEADAERGLRGERRGMRRVKCFGDVYLAWGAGTLPRGEVIVPIVNCELLVWAYLLGRLYSPCVGPRNWSELRPGNRSG